LHSFWSFLMFIFCDGSKFYEPSHYQKDPESGSFLLKLCGKNRKCLEYIFLYNYSSLRFAKFWTWKKMQKKRAKNELTEITLQVHVINIFMYWPDHPSRSSSCWQHASMEFQLLLPTRGYGLRDRQAHCQTHVGKHLDYINHD